jgi:hypothetical protein
MNKTYWTGPLLHDTLGTYRHLAMPISDDMEISYAPGRSKTPGSMTKVRLPDGLAAELRQWKLECPDPSPDVPMFPNADGGFLDPANFRYRVLEAAAGGVGASHAELPVDPADDRYSGTEAGFGVGRSIAPAALTSGDHSGRVHAGASGERAVNGRNSLRDAHQREWFAVGKLKFATKLPSAFRQRRLRLYFN